MDPTRLGRHDSWAGVRAVVLGFGAAGFSTADNLLHLGATVLAVDPEPADPGRPEQAARAERAELLEVLGATVELGGEPRLPAGDVDLVVVSPEWPTDSAVLAAARGRGVPVWGEVNLAWRLRDPARPAPWLCATGATGAAETARLLDAVLRAAGLRSDHAGAGGLPLVEAVMDPEPRDVLAVALTADQLRDAGAMAAESAVVLDVPDAGGAVLGRVYEQVRVACVYAAAVPATEELVREADVVEGARAIGITLGMPAVGMLGVVEDLLVDRAFVPERATSAAELGTLADLAASGPDDVRHALAAAALARAHGVSQQAVRDGLRTAG